MISMKQKEGDCIGTPGGLAGHLWMPCLERSGPLGYGL